MFKVFSSGFWEAVARLILRNRVLILILIGVGTGLMMAQWNKMRFTYTEANLLPDRHPTNLEYNTFLDVFGEEGNIIVLGVKDSTLLTVEKLNAWNRFSKSFGDNENIEAIITLQDLKKLIKNQKNQQFDQICDPLPSFSSQELFR